MLKGCSRPCKRLVRRFALGYLKALAARGDRATALGLTSPPATTLAVGMIREEGVPDTLRIGGVLTDMLATNLARVAGLSVLANSRLFELMLPGQDRLVAGYSTAARSAVATEILQGRLLPGPDWSLALEIQRVDLGTASCIRSACHHRRRPHAGASYVARRETHGREAQQQAGAP